MTIKRKTGRFSLAALTLWAAALGAALAEDRLAVCAACHDTGAGGAPRMGRAQDWSPRLQKGLPQLIASVRHGVPGTLMPSDSCDGCTDAEITRLIRRMSTATQSTP